MRDGTRPILRKVWIAAGLDVAAKKIAEQSNRMQNSPAAQTDTAAQELLDCYRQQEELANRALRSLERLSRLAARWPSASVSARRCC